MALSTIASGAASIALAVSGWAGSSIVENLVSEAYSYLHDRMLPPDCEAELQRIRMALPQISAVMNIAEALKMKHPSAGPWVEQFRLALEASEEVLDEFEYKRLEDMAKKQDEMGRSASSSKKQKASPISDDTLKRLREAVRMLDQAAAGVGSLLQFATMLGISDISEPFVQANKALRRETTSFLVESTVFGRGDEKEKIISWLKQPTEEPLSSFGIVGTGGLGKTTLAQFACQEMKGSNHFDHIIWICVSIGFCVEEITRRILCELGYNNCGADKPLNALQVLLKEKTQSKKILLFLDDVWDDENIRDWEQLIAPLRDVKQGSKVLFTTRMQSVADFLNRVLKIEYKSLQLQGLGEQDLGLLFNSYAFHGINRDDHGDLQAMGDQIIKMLKGSPLAAKVIGSLLNSSPDYNFWSRVLNRDSLFNIEQAKDVMEVLKLSYYHLPTDLHVCFRFCSIFPQDHRFDKDKLIRMWMALGFIRQGASQERPEDIGEDYFNHLLRKSFFDSQSWFGNTYYVMHDLMHELARNVAIGECYRVKHNDKSILIPSSVRHVSVYESEIERLSHLENLHTLVITSSNMNILSQDSFVFPNKLIKKKLRLLVISCRCQLPEEISCLVHLRYLSIIWYPPFMSVLFASIYKLYHLQVLELLEYPHYYYSFDMNIETAGITDLVRLRYMCLPKGIMKTIRGVHKLTSLQELEFFVGKENGHQINELSTLNNLRMLSIYNIENVGDPAEVKGANLLQKKHLISLVLEWTENSSTSNPELVMDNLRPHSNLKNLTIKNYKGPRSPSWMMMLPPINLSSLKLYCCHLRTLPDIPHSLKEFRVDDVGLIRLPNFHQCLTNNTTATVSQKSSLREVGINKCPKLTSLNGFLQQGNLYLNTIQSLLIKNCERLIELPTQGFRNLTSLKRFTLLDCPKLVADEFQGNLLPENIQKLHMENCGELDVPLLKASSGLTNLTVLSISNCANITSISVSGNSFRSLKELSIYNCYGLAELLFLEEVHEINQPSNFIAIKMGKIFIYDCPNLTRVPNLPLSLIEFHIRKVALTSIPEYNTSSNPSNSDPSTTSPESLLRFVEIGGCPNLTSLNSGFGRFISLTKLVITDCPMLLAADNQSNLLPMSLETLEIENCGELELPLLLSASHLTTLSRLEIRNCANITHIPCSQNAFRSLQGLYIDGCDKLVEHSSREQAHDANLQGSSLASLKINNLTIDHLSLLLIEPLRSLRSVRYLSVYDSGMEEFPEQWLLQNSSTLTNLSIENAKTVKSLPATMASLVVLEHLQIDNAELLEELPELPASLISVRITGARSLKSLPATVANLTALYTLRIRDVDLLEELPELPASLRRLEITGARSLKSLPKTMTNLTALKELEITHADLLEMFPELPASLEVKSTTRSDGSRLLRTSLGF